jgi:hypothetical protein
MCEKFVDREFCSSSAILGSVSLANVIFGIWMEIGIDGVM